MHPQRPLPLHRRLKRPLTRSFFAVQRRAQQCRPRRQSAALLPSHAPHDSKARLISATNSRRFVAKPRTPHLHCAARAALQDQGWQCNLSLGGSRGIFSFEKENIPLIRVPHTVWGKPRSAFALPFYPAREKIRKGHLSPFSFFVHCYNGLPLREVCHGHLHRKRLRV